MSGIGSEAPESPAATAAPPLRSPGAWTRIPERGSMAALHFIFGIYRVLGRRACLFMARGIAIYFWIFTASARRASRAYLETLWAAPPGRAALGRKPDWRSTLHHIHEFSINVLDRLVAWSGDLAEIRFEHRGSEVLLDLAASGRGGFLIGAHQGSFDMMRLLASKYGMTVNVLMFTKHASRVNEFFEGLDPNSRVRVLEIDPGSGVRTAFAVRQCIARGEFVGILADRIHEGARERPVFVDFLGRPTPFSLSPFVLASALGCPVVHTQCIRTGDSSYESAATVLTDLIDPRLVRRRKAEALLRAYVAEIEKTCWRAPYQWFNFYDYWRGADQSPAIGEQTLAGRAQPPTGRQQLPAGRDEPGESASALASQSRDDA